jgi:lysophospholipase L1-like esterase
MTRTALCGAVVVLCVTACSAAVTSAAAPPAVESNAPGSASSPAPVPTTTAEAPSAPQNNRSFSEATSDAEGSTAAGASPGGTEPGSTEADDGAPLPTGTTVLQIGDSFAGALGIDLNRELKDSGVRGVLRYETSTYIPTWASKKDLDAYLSRFRPDLVLITLGANELLIPDPSQRAPTIHRLVRRLGGRPCVWVAPPLWEGARPDLLATIREACAPCVYLDSSALVPDLERMRDHIHPSMQGRKIWAKAVLAWLREHRDPHGARPWEMKP